MVNLATNGLQMNLKAVLRYWAMLEISLSIAKFPYLSLHTKPSRVKYTFYKRSALMHRRTSLITADCQ